MNDTNLAIYASKLEKSFSDNHVLKGIDLEIPKGKVFALLGPNGAGKTTTVRIFSTLLKPDSGVAKVGGFDVVTQADEVRGVMGLTGQYAAVDDKLTGTANLEIIGRLYHLSKADAKARAKELITRFELEDAASRAVKTYSGGMRRRLDLAASLIITPPIIFLDEPTTGLDPHSRITMWKIIQQLVDDGTTILLTTQYLEEADQLADKIAVIDHGVVIAQGTADELKSQVGGERLDIKMTSAEDYKKAIKLFESQTLITDEVANVMSFSIEKGISGANKIFTKLEENKINVESFTTNRPTLDDVFLKLTGHEAEIDVIEEK
jgi:ABC-2 type transport system ATP-binding protein